MPSRKLTREQIIKLDIQSADDAHTKIISATGKQIVLQDSASGSDNMTLILKGQGLPRVESKVPVDVIMQMKNGSRVKYPSYTTVSTPTQLNIVIRTSMAHILEERRRYYKVESDINCIINAIVRNGTKLTFDSPAMAQIKDFNIGGIFLCICEENLQKGDMLLLTIMMETGNVDISAEILRVQVSSDGKATGYGCRFLNLTPTLEETFAKYVFKVQIESMKNDKF